MTVLRRRCLRCLPDRAPAPGDLAYWQLSVTSPEARQRVAPGELAVEIDQSAVAVPSNVTVSVLLLRNLWVTVPVRAARAAA